MITARTESTGTGTQNAGLIIGGYINISSLVALSCTEEYNGTSWSVGGSLSVARYNFGGAGTQNAALGFGGYSSGITEEYNGTSWFNSSPLSVGRYRLAGAGTQSAGLAIGGRLGGVSSSSTEEYIRTCVIIDSIQ